MVWKTTAPDGTKSVKDNRSILQDNTTYTKTTMNVDHFWDDATAGNDGHHQFVQMPKSDVGGTPTDPSLAALMDGLVYAKELTSTESVNNQDVKPFFINESAAAGATLCVTQVMQLLGIRAMCVFDVSPAGAITELYKHNCTVTRTSAGRFTATFTAELPTNDYIAIGDCIRRDANPGNVNHWAPQGAATVSTVKSTTFFKFITYTYSGSPSNVDPLQAWFVIFGG